MIAIRVGSQKHNTWGICQVPGILSREATNTCKQASFSSDFLQLYDLKQICSLKSLQEVGVYENTLKTAQKVQDV